MRCTGGMDANICGHGCCSQCMHWWPLSSCLHGCFLASVLVAHGHDLACMVHWPNRRGKEQNATKRCTCLRRKSVEETPQKNKTIKWFRHGKARTREKEPGRAQVFDMRPTRNTVNTHAPRGSQSEPNMALLGLASTEDEGVRGRKN